MIWDDEGRLISCHSVGMGGNCGYDCPVYLGGECENIPEPYRWICLDDTGVALTEGKSYIEIGRDDGFLKIENDDGEMKEFFKSRFDLDEEYMEEAWKNQ